MIRWDDPRYEGPLRKKKARLSGSRLVVCAKCGARLGTIVKCDRRQNHRHQLIPSGAPPERRVLVLDGYKLRDDGFWVPTNRGRDAFRRGKSQRTFSAYRRGVIRNPDGRLYPPAMTPDTLPTYAACVNCDSLNKLDPETLRIEVAPPFSAVLP